MEHATCDVCGLVPIATTARRTTRIVAESAAMQHCLRRAARFAASDAPIVVHGETGSGKEVVARAIHASSLRADAGFVAINVAALPEALLESELFGHAAGSFTGAVGDRRGLFERAHGGTLFLDEIGEMPLSLQAKLLRVLQDGEVRRVGENDAFAVDVRVICATHRDLAALVKSGGFRADLYFRLHVLALQVPPLRDRKDDILPLADAILRHHHLPARGFTAAARARLLAHAWPGNVRELENAIRHGAALARSLDIDVGDLPEELDAPGPAAPARTLAEVERAHVLATVDACGGSLTDAARTLGIGRNTLWRKLRGYSANPS